MGLLGGEKSGVQNPLIQYATQIGWEYVNPDDALRWRCGETGVVFRDIFINQIQKLNPTFMDHLLAAELIKSLERIPAAIEGNLAAWEYLRGVKTVFVPSEKRERDVTFLDVGEIGRNTFHVTDEFSFTNGQKMIRQDIAFLINGFPVLFAETKASHKTDGMAEALKQVKRYHDECPELLAIMQLYSLTHIVKYFYSGTWNTAGKFLFNWKDECGGNFENLVKTFLDRGRILRIITDFILFTRQDDEIKKVVLRPHQMKAVDKIIARAAERGKKRGLIWHTQGSGKTYTMILSAQKIIENPAFGRPTVIMLVDRNELESQLFGHIDSVGIENVVVAESKSELRRILGRDRRGLIVSMIHKFDGMPEKANLRENIFVLVDEAHRTTGGKLGNYLMGALPNATYIGFTGTPIDKTCYGQGTFVTFGKDDPPDGYLDKYSIAESIEDGTTVPLHYTLAENDLQVEKEILEKEFLDLAETEGISDIEQLNRVLEKAVTLRNMLKNKERVEKVAAHVAEHFTKFVEPMGYKAFLVAVDREACALYKDEIDKHLPKEYSEVVYSKGFNDGAELSKYHMSEEEEKRVRKNFRNPEKTPKILIVTEKLLTGFDAPILYAMYLDKPMRDHVLLQAIARVNRPYEDDAGRKKPCGFILDYVGIFGNVKKALAFDSHDIEGVVRDLELLKERFLELVETARHDYLILLHGKNHDKAVEVVLDHFMDEEGRHDFYKFFKELSEIYEILSPDEFLRPYLDDVETLARIYRILREAFEPSLPVDREFTRKTAILVQNRTTTGTIMAGLRIYEINDQTIKKIEESGASDTEKVFNLLKSILKTVQEEAQNSPYLVSIGEKAEEIAQSFKDRQKSTQESLVELKRLVEEINSARNEQAARNIPAEVFSVFWILKREGVDAAEDKANQMKEVFDQFPHWRTSEKQQRSIKQKLYGVLLRGIQEVNTSWISDIAKKVMVVLKGNQQ